MERECSNQSCNRTSCDGCQEKKTVDFSIPSNPRSHVKKVIGVVSGKGGVGKSLVTSLMAVAMRSKNYSTAILDADITGPSIPKMFGIHEKAVQIEQDIQPLYSKMGIGMMSVNLLLEDEREPVIWRGPIVANVVKQFWSDVRWGDVDYMFVDMPPGTGDVPLTVFQSLPLNGIIIVTTPQDLVSMIVSKAVNMAHAMNIPILGIVENMSYFECPDCHNKHYIFGKSDINQVASEYSIPIAATIPISSKLAELCDAGKIEEFQAPWMDDLFPLLQI